MSIFSLFTKQHLEVKFIQYGDKDAEAIKITDLLKALAPVLSPKGIVGGRVGQTRNTSRIVIRLCIAILLLKSHTIA